MPADATLWTIRDILEAYRSFDATPEAKESVLRFVSDLSGLSPDRLLELMEEGGQPHA